MDNKLYKITYKNKKGDSMEMKPVKITVPSGKVPKGNKQSAGETKQKRSGRGMNSTKNFPRNY
jgi:hypothetical protein